MKISFEIHLSSRGRERYEWSVLKTNGSETTWMMGAGVEISEKDAIEKITECIKSRVDWKP